jgi:hypothetical protein
LLLAGVKGLVFVDGVAYQLAEKCKWLSKKCQGTALAVPIKALKRVGFYRLRKNSCLQVLFAPSEVLWFY